jgi:hypothetical protein
LPTGRQTSPHVLMAAPAPQAAASTAPAGSIDLNATLNALLNNPNLSPEDRANMARQPHPRERRAYARTAAIIFGSTRPVWMPSRRECTTDAMFARVGLTRGAEQQLHSQAGIQRLLASGAVPRPAVSACGCPRRDAR